MSEEAGTGAGGAGAEAVAAKGGLSPLSLLFPLAFDPGALRPLKTGIFRDLCQRLPDAEEGWLGEVLSAWTRQVGYLEHVAAGHGRVDLDGLSAGDTLPWQREHALRLLGRSHPPRGVTPEHVRAAAIRDGHPPGTDIKGSDLMFLLEMLGRRDEMGMRGRIKGIRVIESTLGQNALALVSARGKVTPFSLLSTLPRRLLLQAPPAES